MTTTTSTTVEVANRLAHLCRRGNFEEALNLLYAANIVSIEPHESPSGPARLEGIDAVKAKNDWWARNHDVHKVEVAGPWPHGDRFILRFTFDVTGKGGPMAGKHLTIEEAALYTVRNGKIVQEEFFYDMG